MTIKILILIASLLVNIWFLWIGPKGLVQKNESVVNQAVTPSENNGQTTHLEPSIQVNGEGVSILEDGGTATGLWIPSGLLPAVWTPPRDAQELVDLCILEAFAIPSSYQKPISDLLRSTHTRLLEEDYRSASFEGDRVTIRATSLDPQHSFTEHLRSLIGDGRADRLSEYLLKGNILSKEVERTYRLSTERFTNSDGSINQVTILETFDADGKELASSDVSTSRPVFKRNRLVLEALADRLGLTIRE